MSPSLKIRPDFRLHIFDRDKVVFYSDSRSFLLSSEVFVKISIALSDGSKSILDLKSQLTPMFSQDLIDQAFHLMINKGLVLDYCNTTFSSGTQAFWYENGFDARALESSIENRKISVKAFCNNSNELIPKFTHFLESLGFSFSGKWRVHDFRS
jgi:hypothetical protein